MRSEMKLAGNRLPVRHTVELLDAAIQGVSAESLREIAIVSQEQQALTLCVEPADIEEPGKFRRQQIVDRIGRVRVAAGANKTRRLVQGDRERLGRPNESVIDFYMVALFDLHAEIRAWLAVDRDAAARDELVTITPRAEAGRGEVAV